MAAHYDRDPGRYWDGSNNDVKSPSGLVFHHTDAGWRWYVPDFAVKSMSQGMLKEDPAPVVE